MQVKAIILYNHQGERRVVPFKLGAVNIITGESKTGKSSLINILDFCLGRQEFTMFEGVNRDIVAW
jgi:putative ribosome biogenesis GTPase RsgA